MGVNRVEFNGKPVIDISDSTIYPDILPLGEVGYTAAGERVIGKKEPESVTVGLPASGWAGNTAPYTQTVSVPFITAEWQFYSITGETEKENLIQKVREGLSMIRQVESWEGNLTFICNEEKPEIDLVAIMTRGVQLDLKADGWTGSEEKFVQMVEIDGVNPNWRLGKPTELNGEIPDGDLEQMIMAAITGLGSVTILMESKPQKDLRIALKKIS